MSSGRHEKKLWVGTFGGGLSLYNKEKENFTNFVHDPKNEFSIFSNQILTIFEDSKNRIWVGANQAGVSLIDINNSSDSGRVIISDLSISKMILKIKIALQVMW